MTGQNSATLAAGLVMGQLLAAGVREVVLAPGSRSAPLAFAAAALEREGRIRLHVRVDERSAGFLALGLAKVSGLPTPVIVTSGTAVANLMPAVVEAFHSGIPLVAVTADRPPRARSTGSPQTIDQVGFFEGFAVGIDVIDTELDGNAPDTAPDTVPLADALAHAQGRWRMPVHVNVGLTPPLTPPLTPALTPAGPADAPGIEPLPAVTDSPTPVDLPERSVILLGDVPAYRLPEVLQRVDALAAATGWPVIGEPSGNAHLLASGVAHAPLIVEGLDVEGVLSIGTIGLSRPILRMVGRARRHCAVHLVGPDAPDPLRSASEILDEVPTTGTSAAPAEWMAAWRREEARVERLIEEQVRDFSGLWLGRNLAGLLPADALLLVAASWSVRHVEALAPRRAGPTVIGNRGANGIDGLISTAWGAALAHQGSGGGPAVALMGDLAFLHDHNGLFASPGEPEPHLVIVVADNDGGGIFHQLEQGAPAYADDFERIFGTPTGRDLAAIATAAGIPTTRVSSAPGFQTALADALAGSGVQVIVAASPGRAHEAAVLEGLRESAAQPRSGSA